MRTFIASKIHGIRVTGKGVAYHGSVTVCRALLAAAGIQPYEQVHVVNLRNGARWITYALPGEEGQFELNGGGARLGEIGDECIVLAYQTAATMKPASVVFVDERNRPADAMAYQHA